MVQCGATDWNGVWHHRADREGGEGGEGGVEPVNAFQHQLRLPLGGEDTPINEYGIMLVGVFRNQVYHVVIVNTSAVSSPNLGWMLIFASCAAHRRLILTDRCIIL